MDPTTLYIIREALDATKSDIDSNEERLEQHLHAIENGVRQIQQNIGDEALRDLRRGWEHLRRSRSADTAASRDRELHWARDMFAGLSSHSLTGKTESSEGTIANKVFVIEGRYGSFHYFLLQGDPSNAAVEAYKCTTIEPQLGLELFPSKLFSKPYRQTLDGLSKRISSLKGELSNREQNNAAEHVAYWFKRSMKVLGVIGSTVAGLAGTVIHPASALAGYAAAKACLEAEVKTPALLDTSEVKAELGKVEAAYKQGLSALLAECNQRTHDLENEAA